MSKYLEGYLLFAMGYGAVSIPLDLIGFIVEAFA